MSVNCTQALCTPVSTLLPHWNFRDSDDAASTIILSVTVRVKSKSGDLDHNGTKSHVREVLFRTLDRRVRSLQLTGNYIRV